MSTMTFTAQVIKSSSRSGPKQCHSGNMFEINQARSKTFIVVEGLQPMSHPLLPIEKSCPSFTTSATSQLEFLYWYCFSFVEYRF